MKIAGLDIGTTGCKVTVFDENGAFVGRSYRDYPLIRGAFSREIDIKKLTEGVLSALGEMVAAHPDIKSIGVTSFGEAFVMTDGEGKPLNNALIYTDPRGAEECSELVRKLGADRIARITGLSPHQMFSISKIMWFKRHMPDVFDRARHIFLISDYIVYVLTGERKIDYSLASRTMAFDIINLNWSEDIFKAAGIDVCMMSEPVPPGTVAGSMNGIDVIVAGHDQVTAAVGSGVFDGSSAVDGAGTVQCLTPIYDTLPDIGVMSENNYCVVPYVIPGKYAAYAFSYTGGALIKWCLDCFGKGETNVSLENAYTGSGPTGLLVLPHFAGAATPYMDTGSKGAIVGLTTGTTAPEIYRACMEGVCYEMCLNYETLKNTGIRFKSLSATGGGAKSSVWMQMKADMLDLPITTLETSDAGTVGCAMEAGIAAGIFKDLREAASVMVKKCGTYVPSPEMHEKYMDVYKRYRELYKAIRPLV